MVFATNVESALNKSDKIYIINNIDANQANEIISSLSQKNVDIGQLSNAPVERKNG
jgi:hypothetical protein